MLSYYKLIRLLILLSLCLILLAGCRQNISFSGEMKEGKPHGPGILTYPNGTIYEGKFELGKLWGEGIFKHPSGIIYHGHWENNLYHGRGVLEVPGEFTYEGEFNQGKKDGYGEKTWADNHRYEGKWENGRRHGEGTMYFPDGSYFTGEYINDRKHGQGVLHQADGETLSGLWESGQFRYIPVEVISLNKSKLSFIVDDPAEQLMAFIFPEMATDQEVTWSSDNPEIATVSGGLVTPLKAGQTTITATALAEGLNSECLVTVENPPVEVTGVTIDQAELFLTIGDDPVTLKAAVEPEDADDQSLSWQSSDPEIATVDQLGEVTPLAAGQTVITVNTTDQQFSAASLVTVYSDTVTADVTEPPDDPASHTGATEDVEEEDVEEEGSPVIPKREKRDIPLPSRPSTED